MVTDEIPSTAGAEIVPDQTARIGQLEADLSAERTRRRGLLAVLIGVAALELSRELAPLTHPAVALFGAVFCLVYVLYGLFVYSTQEKFVKKP